MKGLESLGKEVARRQDEVLAERAVVDQAVSSLRWQDEAAPSRGRWVALAAGLVLVLGGGLVAWRATRPLSLETKDVAVGVWLAPVAEQPLAFSDGATVLMTPGSRFKVSELHPNGARLTIERGRATVSVPHRERTRWAFEVGPFTVHVVGTRFEAGWDPSTETFSLVMQDGAVKVSGPDLDQAQYVAGQTVSRTLTTKPLTPAVEVPVVDVPVVDVPPPSTSSSRPVVAAWRVLFDERQYAQALAAAKPQWSRWLATSPADDLVLLGDAARLARDGAAASEAYQSVLRRFPGSRAAGTATFLLGRLAFDAHDTSAAMEWFSTYRTRFPKGPLVAEALGRQLELARSHDEALARRLAREYLEAYPEGPHSRVAKAVLAK